jgi:hypothetical protein
MMPPLVLAVTTGCAGHRNPGGFRRLGRIERRTPPSRVPCGLDIGINVEQAIGSEP